MEMPKIACGIVIYNPNNERLEQNLSAIVSQVDHIILIDNSDNYTLSPRWLNNSKVEYINNGCNKGIANALNQIVRISSTEGYEWVLTLDQDSICPRDMVLSYLRYIKTPRLAMIAPLIKDRNSMEQPYRIADLYYDVDRCITSGTLTNTEAVLKVGGFDSRLFIDYVDFELCARLIDAGYRIIQDCNTILLHQYGNIKEFRLIGFTIRTTNHNPKRKYYQVRNRIYCSRKYSHFFSCWRTTAFIFAEWIKVLCFESEKMQKVVAIHKGIIDGLRM